MESVRAIDVDEAQSLEPCRARWQAPAPAALHNPSRDKACQSSSGTSVWLPHFYRPDQTMGVQRRR
jgi:hypothetical protein